MSPSIAGFSLTEMLVVLVILGIASGLVGLTFKAAVDSRNVAMSRIDIMEKGRAALDLMATEFQSAFLNDLGYLPVALPPSPPIPGCGIRGHPGTGGYPPDVSPYAIPREILGDGIDNDNDGLIDEVQLRFTGRPGSRSNGFDDDGDGLIDEDGAEPVTGVDDDGDGITDEDGPYPADMVNFAITRSRAGERFYDIVEAGYTVGVVIDALGDQSTRLLRRFSGIPASADDIQPVDGQFIIDQMDGTETWFTILYVTPDPENDVDVLSFDTVGFRLTYWYYNYAIAQELEPYGGDCSAIPGGALGIDNDGDGVEGEDPVDGEDNDNDGRIDEDPPPFDTGICDGPWRSTREWESGIERYPNELEDINVDELVMAGVDCDQNFVYLGALDRMDGLPDMVEIEIWVLDRERRERTPQRLTTRVQIPRR